MTTFRYDGEDERVFPSIRVTAKKGDTFEASDDFTAPDCVAVNSPSKSETVTESVSTDTSAGA